MRALVFMAGGFGDMLMASPAFAALKKQGYIVDLLTDERGAGPVLNDPNLDSILILDPDNPLDKSSYDKIVDLSRVITSGPLKLAPDRGTDDNYVEALFGKAGIRVSKKHRTAPVFYPTFDEQRQVKDFFARHPARTRVMWALSGSSMHKQYPWTHSVIKFVAPMYPQLQFLLVGDQHCQVIEQEFAGMPNVIPLSGRIDIRSTMALAKKCDMLVSPETGVLQAVAGTRRVRKLVLLSHSSKNNLVKNWINTRVFEPVAPCYPCHQIHVSWEHCHRSKNTGAALCATSIKPEPIAQEIIALHEAKKNAA